MIKPMLACDHDPNKVQFPIYGQPKIDGVRALVQDGVLTGRSLKKFKNIYATEYFSCEELNGFDGEMIVGNETDSDLCRMTTSALGRYDGSPSVTYILFDYVTDKTRSLPYCERYRILIRKVNLLQGMDPEKWGCLNVVDCYELFSIEDLEDFQETKLDEGYEGIVLRGIESPHKAGRCTVKEGSLLRVKTFLDAEAIVVSLNEGGTNMNVAKTNELGHTYRTSHQDNIIPNGQIGSLQCNVVNSIKFKGYEVIAEGDIITVSAGSMTHNMRKYYFENQNEIVGKLIKFKFFPTGVKDKPRFPTFVSLRDSSDI